VSFTRRTKRAMAISFRPRRRLDEARATPVLSFEAKLLEHSEYVERRGDGTSVDLSAKSASV
jgi:hypothetical protein